MPCTSCRTRGRAARGFTLLESVAALSVLTGVAIICMQLRVQAAVHAVELSERASAQHAAAALLELAVSGMLPAGEGPEEDDPLQRITWTGSRLGKKYTCTRERITIKNPVAGAPGVNDGAVAQLVEMNRFSVECAGVTLETIRPLGK